MCREQPHGQGDVSDDDQQAAERQEEEALVDQLDLDVAEALAVGSPEQAQHHPADDHEGGGRHHRQAIDPSQGNPGFVGTQVRLAEVREADEEHRDAPCRVDGLEPWTGSLLGVRIRATGPSGSAGAILHARRRRGPAPWAPRGTGRVGRHSRAGRPMIAERAAFAVASRACFMRDSGDSRPLVVDLDGTLVKTDLLAESVCALLGASPLRALSLPGWLWRGKAHLKRRIAEQREVDVDVSSLPYDQAILDRIRAARAEGRPTFLASASDERYVAAVAGHLGLFDGWFGSDGTVNLRGRAKARRLVERFRRAGLRLRRRSRGGPPCLGAGAHRNSGRPLTRTQAAAGSARAAGGARGRVPGRPRSRG